MARLVSGAARPPQSQTAVSRTGRTQRRVTTSVTSTSARSTKAHVALHIREPYGRDRTNVPSVGGPTAGSQLSGTIRRHTQERGPMSVRSVGKPSARKSPLPSISELTLGKNHISAKSVGSLSAISQRSRCIRGFTPERNRIHVTNVGKATVGSGL